jgi:predicted transcriptional regulator
MKDASLSKQGVTLGWQQQDKPASAAPAPPEKPDLFVIVRILERLWRKNEPMLRTHLQVASNVNWNVFMRYLTWLLDRELVSMNNSENGQARVRITPKGYDAYKRLVEWLDEFVHGTRS